MFVVGSGRYSVRVTDGPLIHDGRECQGTCDEVRRLVLLSASLPPERRLQTLLHELFHAWLYACGLPREDEAACDLFATAAHAVMHDLLLCGGEEALRNLRPGEQLGQSSRVTLTQSRQCRCGGTVAPGDVECRRDPCKPDQMTLSMSCEFCGVTMTWNELATYGGLPGGVVVGRVRVERAGKNVADELAYNA